VPAVAVGEDEFVELDENGNPKKKGARSARPPKAPAPVRARRPANTAQRRRPLVASIAAEPDEAGETAVFEDTGEAQPRSATASAGRSRTGTGNPPSRGRGPGGGPRRG
jgi:hypothetical protein